MSCECVSSPTHAVAILTHVIGMMLVFNICKLHERARAGKISFKFFPIPPEGIKKQKKQGRPPCILRRYLSCRRRTIVWMVSFFWTVLERFCGVPEEVITATHQFKDDLWERRCIRVDDERWRMLRVKQE